MMNYIYFVPNGYMVHGNFIGCPTCNNRFKETSPKPDNWTCPRCGTSQKKATYVFQVKLISEKHKITISLPKEGEVLQFNVGKGRVVFTSKNNAHPLDVTERIDFLSEKMRKVLENTKTRELLLESFQYAWGAKRVPFLPKELSLEALFLITRFVGYSRIFFTHIPLILGTLKLPREFQKTAKHMHHAWNVLRLTSTLDWCQNEEIRFQVFKVPALLFYQKSLSMIYDCLADEEAFRMLLSTEASLLFEHLAFLSDCPACKTFLQDYIFEAGTAAYLKLVQYHDLFSECSRSYTCLNPQRRKQVKSTFKAGLDPLEMHIRHSLPTKLSSVQDTTINLKNGASFDFIAVNSTFDMCKLGDGLSNPVLKNLIPPLRLIDECGAVIGVWKGFQPVAHIEVTEDKRIIEIEGPNGSSFSSLNDEIKTAIYKWMELHHLEDIGSFYLSDEDDGDFCF